MILASCIDLDHFVAARSFYLKDATNIKNRPPLHCTTLPLSLTIVLLLFAYIQRSNWLIRLSLIIFTAFISHHTRDAVRRGFWLYPWGSTKPISYLTYISLTVIFPYIISTFMNYMLNQKSVVAPITV
ncbi:hypothetical protein FQR65_LT05603 [Abscondita terminalis]|nr:hypothetical protein FQR65_LT05603 [Abscondita terminalis]